MSNTKPVGRPRLIVRLAVVVGLSAVFWAVVLAWWGHDSTRRPVGTFQGPGPTAEQIARYEEQREAAAWRGLAIGLVAGALGGAVCAFTSHRWAWILAQGLVGLAGGLGLDGVGAAGMWWGIELVLLGGIVGAVCRPLARGLTSKEGG
jgi:hypothetical protein